MIPGLDGWGVLKGLKADRDLANIPVMMITIVDNPGLAFTISTVATLTGGTMFLMWLGEQITSRGVGNGVSLIIFAGIVSVFPNSLRQAFALAQTGAIGGGALVVIATLSSG